MMKTRVSLLLPLLFLVSAIGAAAQQRQILYTSKNPSDKLLAVTNLVRNLDTKPVACEALTRETEFFVRIAERKFILTPDGQLQKTAVPGTKPFVFLTTPESVYGRSLLDLYEGIGYEAEDIIRMQRNREMVMLIFRYPQGVAVSDVANGLLPAEWNKRIYIPTWDNIFSLFQQQTLLEPINDKGTPCESALCMSPSERAFVLGFSEEGKQRVKQSAYAALKAVGGADWTYRQLLEKKFSVFEHFRGNGRTQNEVRDPEGVEGGLIEFVGPSTKLGELPELTIIKLGTLIIETDYGDGKDKRP